MWRSVISSRRLQLTIGNRIPVPVNSDNPLRPTVRCCFFLTRFSNDFDTVMFHGSGNGTGLVGNCYIRELDRFSSFSQVPLLPQCLVPIVGVVSVAAAAVGRKRHPSSPTTTQFCSSLVFYPQARLFGTLAISLKPCDVFQTGSTVSSSVG